MFLFDNSVQFETDKLAGVRSQNMNFTCHKQDQVHFSQNYLNLVIFWSKVGLESIIYHSWHSICSAIHDDTKLSKGHFTSHTFNRAERIACSVAYNCLATSFRGSAPLDGIIYLLYANRLFQGSVQHFICHNVLSCDISPARLFILFHDAVPSTYHMRKTWQWSSDCCCITSSDCQPPGDKSANETRARLPRTCHWHVPELHQPTRRSS